MLHADVALPRCQTLAAEEEPDAAEEIDQAEGRDLPVTTITTTCATASSSTTTTTTTTTTAATASSISWLALNYTEDVVGEALGRPPVMGSGAAGKQKVAVSQMVSSLHREVEVCRARNASASVTA